MRPLRLLKHFSRYNAGEIAGFEDAEAERLIAQGIATADLEPAPAAEAAAPEADPAPADTAPRKKTKS